MICQRQLTATMLIQTKLRSTECVITALFAFCTGSLAAANWQATLSKEPPGNFAGLRPLHASYRFGWSGFTAATGEVRFAKPSQDRFQFDGTGRTIGGVKALSQFDVHHRAVASAAPL